MHESKLLGTLLPAHPDIQPILQLIRKKYSIPDLSIGDDDSRELLLAGHNIDWKAAEEELDFRIRHLSNILPPDLAEVQRMIDGRKKAPKKIKFDEPTTPKLRKDIYVLYNSFLRMWDKVIELSTFQKQASDRFLFCRNKKPDGVLEDRKNT